MTSDQETGGDIEITTSGGDDSADKTTGGDGAADESSGESKGVIPIGDYYNLVECDPQSQCEVKSDFLDCIEAYFESFFEENVTLSIVDDAVPCGPEVRIGGLDPGESATELADILNLDNGDIIREVESILVKSILDAAKVISSIFEDPSMSMTVWRPGGPYCSSRVYNIDVL